MADEDTNLVAYLLNSHVVRVAGEQVDALPRSTNAELRADLGERALPFQSVFLDLGHCHLGVFDPGDEGDRPLAAAVLFQQVHTAPVVGEGIGDAVGAAGVEAYPFLAGTVASRRVALLGRFTKSLELTPAKAIARNGPQWGENWAEQAGKAAGRVVDRGLGVLRLLECIGVDLEEVALPRQQRRQAERKGERIPLEVVVRTASRRPSVPRNGDAPDWSHRWEVRGHFKHVTRGREFEAAPPEKRIVVDGVECVRKWCPPHVKGPEGKPLIPKWRRVAQ